MLTKQERMDDAIWCLELSLIPTGLTDNKTDIFIDMNGVFPLYDLLRPSGVLTAACSF